MASTTGDGAEQPEASTSVSPATGAAGPPNGSGGDDAAAANAPALPPPVAVPTVRSKAERSIKGQTTASDYVAPRELPTNTPRPVETVAAKVVLDVPDSPIVDEASSPGTHDPEMAEQRQRRRAPTLKIERSAVKELQQLDDARIARAEAAVAALAAAQAQAAGHHVGPPSVRTSGPGMAPDTPRPLARPASDRPGPRSGSRTAGWLIALTATAVVGGGALAVGMGWVPGLAPSDDVSPGVATPSATTPRAPTAEPAATPTVVAAPIPTEEPAVAPEPSASAAPSASTAPRPPLGAPWPAGRPPSRPPPTPRPRPKSDIPQGI